jgi:predicted DNA-binding transcriptional regulator YafY
MKQGDQMSNTATRLITLIMLLQRRPNQKAADLAEALNVSVRTLHRYIGMLDEMGIPIYSERGPYGGFSLVRGYKMPPLVLSNEEAVAVYLGTSLVEEMWGRLYQEAARGALAKLDNMLPDEQRHEVAWARRALVATGFHRANIDNLAPFLEKLRRAVRERRLLRMVYRTRSQPQPTKRELAPYALVHRWGWWYAIGFCQLRQALRSFRVDRIIELTLLDKVFKIPDDFNIKDYLAQEPYTQPTFKVRMHFVPHANAIAYDNRAYWETLEEQPDGSVMVIFATNDMEFAASTALSYSGLAVVEAPEELRRLVAERAARITEMHQSELQTVSGR